MISGPQIETQGILPSQKACECDLCEGQILGDHCHLGVSLVGGRGCKQFFGLVVGPHAMGIELVRHPLDRDLHLGNLGVVEGLSVSGPRRQRDLQRALESPSCCARGR